MWKLLLIWSILCGGGALGHIMFNVYYESLCPDSADFLVNQFHPVYLDYADHMMVKLVPFGNANATKNTDGSWKFECQHGDAECYGNKVQSCALELFEEKESFEFIYCAMNSGNASLDKNLETCAKSSNITWTSIQECIDSGKGDEYLVANGELTAKFFPANTTSVPTIVFEGTYNKQLQSLSLIDFKDLAVFIDEQVDCDFCQFIAHNSGSKRSFSFGILISAVSLLTMIIHKLFAID